MNVKQIPLATVALLLAPWCQSIAERKSAEPRPTAPYKLLYTNDTTKLNGTALNPVSDVSAIYDNPFDTMITPHENTAAPSRFPEP